MSTVTIRPRSEDDLQELGEILKRVYAHDGYPVEGVGDPAGWLRPPRLIAAWTALHDGELVGHAALVAAGPDDDVARAWKEYTGRSIDNLVIPARLFVDPDHQRLGVGSALMHARRAYVADHHWSVAFEVMLKDQAAIRLNEAAGAIRIDTINHVHSGGRIEPAAVYIEPGTLGSS